MEQHRPGSERSGRRSTNEESDWLPPEGDSLAEHWHRRDGRGRRRRESLTTSGEQFQPIYIPPASSFSGSRSRSPVRARPHTTIAYRAPTPGPAFVSPSFTRPHSTASQLHVYGLHPASAYTLATTHADDRASSFIAVDPFRPTSTLSVLGGAPAMIDHTGHPEASTKFSPYQRRYYTFSNFAFDTVPRQIYLYFLLYFPSFYFSRVARIFEEADLSIPEIKSMAVENARQFQCSFATLPKAVPMGPHMLNLKTTWENFIDSLLREWKTLNIVSVLLLSAISTLLQIQGAGNDPLTRNCALVSLICALMSLLYGCMFIIRFGTMRKPHKAAEWAAEAQRTKTMIWWNVWVLLAMPATWLAWAILLYIASIMSFVWRSGTATYEPTYTSSSRLELWVRIAISAVLFLGLVYFALIAQTFSRYGGAMDRSFKAKVSAWAREQGSDKESYRSRFTVPPIASNVPLPELFYHQPQSTATLEHANSKEDVVLSPTLIVPAMPSFPSDGAEASTGSPFGAFAPIKVMNLRFQNHAGNPMPDFLMQRMFTHSEWVRFIEEAVSAWTNNYKQQHQRFGTMDAPPRPQDAIAEVLERWNRFYFNPRHAIASLCLEYYWEFPHSPAYAVYLVHIEPGQSVQEMGEIFADVPEGLSRIDVFDPLEAGRSRRRMLGRQVYLAPSAQVPTELERVHWAEAVGGATRRQMPRRRSPHPRLRSRSPLHRSPSPDLETLQHGASVSDASPPPDPGVSPVLQREGPEGQTWDANRVDPLSSWKAASDSGSLHERAHSAPEDSLHHQLSESSTHRSSQLSLERDNASPGSSSNRGSERDSHASQRQDDPNQSSPDPSGQRQPLALHIHRPQSRSPPAGRSYVEDSQQQQRDDLDYSLPPPSSVNAATVQGDGDGSHHEYIFTGSGRSPSPRSQTLSRLSDTDVPTTPPPPPLSDSPHTRLESSAVIPASSPS